MALVLVVLSNPLSNLSRCDAHDGVRGCVEARFPFENGDSESSLFQCLLAAIESLLHHESEECRIAFAATKVPARDQPLGLAKNLLFFRFANLTDVHLSYRHDLSTLFDSPSAALNRLD
jgi:hypothetical protein